MMKISAVGLWFSLACQLCNAQNILNEASRYQESAIPSDGLTYQTGPGSSSGWDWTYKYGVKLSVFGNTNRNFELMNTGKTATSSLVFRTYDTGLPGWTGWRKLLQSDVNGNISFSVPDFFSAAQANYNGDVLLKSKNTPGKDNYGGSISFSKVDGSVGKRAAIVAKQTSGDPDGVGLAFFTHTDAAGDDLKERFLIDHNGNIKIKGGTFQLRHTYEDYANVLNFRTRDNNRHGDFRFESEKTDASETRTIMFLDGDKRGVSVGSELIPSGFRFAVDGNAVFEEVKIQDVQGADFVFEEDYDLKPLSEVEKYISENGHLPGIPSASEMQENGVQMGELNMILLQKIEELTLYLIEKEETIQKLVKRIEILEKDRNE